MSGLQPTGRRFDRRSITLGAVAMVGPSVLAILVLGLDSAVVPIVLSGVLGGFVAGWASPDPDATAYERRAGGLHGMNAAGLGGLVLVAGLLALDVPATAEGGISLLLVASPFALLVFVAGGFVGGYAGMTLRLRSMA